MADISNASFEIAGPTIGSAEDWTLTTVVAAWEVAEWDPDALGYEDFETAVADVSSFVPATWGVSDPAEDFEKLWGPFDGSDPDWPNVVPVGLAENSSFVFTFPAGISATFSNIFTYEDFDWGVNEGTPYVTVWEDVLVTEDATFGLGTVEDFETGWSNDTYEDDFDALATETSSFYFTAPQSFESFEFVIDADDVAQIVSATNGFYTLTLNEREFTYNRTGVASPATIATNLTNLVNNTSDKYTAEILGGFDPTWIGVQIEDTNIPLITTITGPTAGTVLLLSPILRQDYWLLPDKTA